MIEAKAAAVQRAKKLELDASVAKRWQHREREIEVVKESAADRQTGKPAERQKDRKTVRQEHRKTATQKDWHTARQKDRALAEAIIAIEAIAKRQADRCQRQFSRVKSPQ